MKEHVLLVLENGKQCNVPGRILILWVNLLLVFQKLYSKMP